MLKSRDKECGEGIRRAPAVRRIKVDRTRTSSLGRGGERSGPSTKWPPSYMDRTQRGRRRRGCKMVDKAHGTGPRRAQIAFPESWPGTTSDSLKHGRHVHLIPLRVKANCQPCTGRSGAATEGTIVVGQSCRWRRSTMHVDISGADVWCFFLISRQAWARRGSGGLGVGTLSGTLGVF